MPNSAWTETGSPISLTSVSTPVSVASSPDDVNYLSNSGKIDLMAQYAAELAAKTSLDATAASLSVSSAAYDAAVAAVNTTLTQAGAPSNWATTWPDGTTFGPVVGIQTLLANDWSAIATQRSALQSAIAAANAAAAQTAAISAAAADATTKMDSAVTTAQNLAPMVVSALPTLPNATYPNGKVVWNAADSKLYQNNAGAWMALVVSGANIEAGSVTATEIASNTITAGQIAAGAIGAQQIAAGAITTASLTVTDFTNLIPNSTSEDETPAGGWPAGAFEAVDLKDNAQWAYLGTQCRAFLAPQNGEVAHAYTPLTTCAPGDSFYASAYTAVDPFAGAYRSISVDFFNSAHAWLGQGSSGTRASDGWVGAGAGDGVTPNPSYVQQTVTAVAPAGAAFVQFNCHGNGGNNANTQAGFDNMVLRRMADANLIVNGAITADKISAGAITGDMITAGVLTAKVIYFTDGFCLNTLEPKEAGANVTANHVLTQKATCSNVSISLSNNQAVTGLDWSVAAQGPSDVYNISGVLHFIASNMAGVAQCLFHVYVDGNTSTDYGAGAIFASGNSTGSATGGAGPVFGVVAGLSAGSHTIQVYVDYSFTSGSGPVNISLSGFAFCQRVF